MVDKIKLGQFLRERRRDKKLTQAETAEILGISERALRNIERGKTVTDLDTLSRMFDLFDIIQLDLRPLYTRDADMAYIMTMYHIITEYDLYHQREKLKN